MDAVFEAKYIVYTPVDINYECEYQLKTIPVIRTNRTDLQIWQAALEKAMAYAEEFGYELDSLTVIAI